MWNRETFMSVKMLRLSRTISEILKAFVIFAGTAASDQQYVTTEGRSDIVIDLSGLFIMHGSF